MKPLKAASSRVSYRTSRFYFRCGGESSIAFWPIISHFRAEGRSMSLSKPSFFQRLRRRKKKRAAGKKTKQRAQKKFIRAPPKKKFVVAVPKWKSSEEEEEKLFFLFSHLIYVENPLRSRHLPIKRFSVGRAACERRSVCEWSPEEDDIGLCGGRLPNI